jgi:hypothetical protein
MGRLASLFLKLKVLDRAADPVQLRKRPLGDDLGNEVQLAARPELQPEEQGQGAREASLGAWQKRVGAAVGIRIGSLERQLPA